MAWWSRNPKEPVRRPSVRIDEQRDSVFRRSRTLTGSASSKVSATNESKSFLKSHRLKAHELKKHRRLLGAGLLGVLVLISLCFWLLDQYIVDVGTIHTSQSLTRPLKSNDYQAVIKDYLDSRPAERFRFLLNEERLNAFVIEKQPEVQHIVVENGDGLVSTQASISVRVPVASWHIQDTTYYVDSVGQSYKVNYFAEPEVSVKDQSGISPDSTSVFASTRLLEFLGQVVAGVNSSNVGVVKEVVIPAGTLRQLDITLDSVPYRIKTHMDREAVGQVADIVSAVGHLQVEGITPQYVDVRVEGRAYYR